MLAATEGPLACHTRVTPAEAVSVLPPTGAAAEVLLCFGENPHEATAGLGGHGLSGAVVAHSVPPPAGTDVLQDVLPGAELSAQRSVPLAPTFCPSDAMIQGAVRAAGGCAWL